MNRIRISRMKLPLAVRVAALYACLMVAVGIGVNVQPSETAPSVSAIRVAETTQAVPDTYVVSGDPVAISVPRLGIQLEIINGEYDASQDSWTLSDNKVQFANVTDLPNDDAGNTFLYGHNTANVFAPLSGLSPGDEAIITTSNGLTFTYLYESTTIVQPNATFVLDAAREPTLTLMTCDGLFDESRRIASFKLKGVS